MYLNSEVTNIPGFALKFNLNIRCMLIPIILKIIYKFIIIIYNIYKEIIQMIVINKKGVK